MCSKETIKFYVSKVETITGRSITVKNSMDNSILKIPANQDVVDSEGFVDWIKSFIIEKFKSLEPLMSKTDGVLYRVNFIFNEECSINGEVAYRYRDYGIKTKDKYFRTMDEVELKMPLSEKEIVSFFKALQTIPIFEKNQR